MIGGGSKLQLSIASTLTTIGEITDIKLDGISVAEIDKTHMQSLNGTKPITQYEYGHADYGTWTFEGNLLPAMTDQLITAIQTNATWRVSYPDNSGWDFAGCWTSYGEHAPTKEEASMSLKIRITSVMTHTS